MFSIFLYTNQFLTSLAGFWVCSNEWTPTTPLQQSIRGIIESPSFNIGVRACAHSKILGVHIPLSFVCTLSSLALLFLSVALSYMDFRKHFWTSTLPVLDAFFFSQKEYPPTWQSIPSHTPPTYTPKIGLRKTILEFLLHTRQTVPIVFAIFWTILSSSFTFFFGSVSIPFSSRFYNYEKKKICPIYLLSSVSGGFTAHSQLMHGSCSQSPSSYDMIERS